MTSVNLDLAKRQINMRLDLPRPEGCVVINGTTLVVVGTKTVETDLYSAKVLTECVTVEKQRQCGKGVIKLTMANLDKLGVIKEFWADCQYHEYRLLYDSGAVLK